MIPLGLFGASFLQDADAAAFISARSIANTTEVVALHVLVQELKSASIWPKLRCCYPFAGATAFTQAGNLKSTGVYDLTFHGGITHSANGVQWNGTTGYADTGFVPSGTLTQNSEHYSYYSRSSSTANGYDIGSAHLTGQYQWSGVGTYAAQFNAFINNANSATATVTVNIADGSGYWVGSRTSSNSLSAFRNGISLGSNTETNIWVQANNTVCLGATNLGSSVIQFSPRQMAFATIGDGLTPTDVANLYSIVQAYQTALGRAV